MGINAIGECNVDWISAPMFTFLTPEVRTLVHYIDCTTVYGSHEWGLDPAVKT